MWSMPVSECTMRNCLLVSWSSGLSGEANEHLALVDPGVPAVSTQRIRHQPARLCEMIVRHDDHCSANSATIAPEAERAAATAGGAGNRAAGWLCGLCG